MDLNLEELEQYQNYCISDAEISYFSYNLSNIVLNSYMFGIINFSYIMRFTSDFSPQAP